MFLSIEFMAFPANAAGKDLLCTGPHRHFIIQSPLRNTTIVTLGPNSLRYPVQSQLEPVPSGAPISSILGFYSRTGERSAYLRFFENGKIEGTVLTEIVSCTR